MAKKKKTDIDSEIDFPAPPRTLYDAAMRCRLGNIKYREDLIFALLCLCGMPTAEAYRVSNPGSRASVNSSSTLGSRRLAEPNVQEFINSLLIEFDAGRLTLSTKCVRGLPSRDKYSKSRFNSH